MAKKTIMTEMVNYIKRMKKEDYIVLALVGILIVIIALPTDTNNSKQEKTNSKDTETIMETKKYFPEENTGQNGQKNDNNICYDSKLDFSTSNYYVENMENQVKHILKNISGAGNVEVMITLSNLGEEIVEKDTDVAQTQTLEADSAGGSREQQEDTRTYETIYTVDEAGNNVPYVVQTLLPRVEGVVVLAEGADIPKVKENIIEAMEVLFNLSEHKIKVIKMKS